jgi:hypothetical protein
MEREQQAGNTLDAVDARMNLLEQEVWWLVAGPLWQKTWGYCGGTAAER